LSGAKPSRRRRFAEAFFSSLFAPLRVESEVWFWVRECVTFAPGAIGVSARRAFYRRSFRRSGDDIVIMAGAYIEHPQNVEVGDRCTFGRNCWIGAHAPLKLGNDVGVGPSVIIHTANHRFDDRNVPILQQGHDEKPVEIEDDVWLAAGARVMPGTRIGRGAVIAAGSVISGPIEPYAIMVGFPARRIGVRGAAAKEREPNDAIA